MPDSNAARSVALIRAVPAIWVVLSFPGCFVPSKLPALAWRVSQPIPSRSPTRISRNSVPRPITRKSVNMSFTSSSTDFRNSCAPWALILKKTLMR